MRPARILTAIGAAAVLAALLAWHLRPVLVWHLNVSPSLEDHRNANRMNVETLVDFPEPRPDWPLLEVANLAIRAPIPADQRRFCDRCSSHCVLQIESGTLAIFDESPPESYREALDLVAPDEDDISVFRSAWRNWHSIDALAGRVVAPSDLAETFRFHSSGSKGVVSDLLRGDIHRFVIYAYSPRGDPTRVVGITGAEIEVLRRVLGTLVVKAVDHGEDKPRFRTSRCE